MLTQLLSSSDRRVARQTLQMGAITAVQILGGLAQIAISARILGPEGFGVLAVIIAVAFLVHLLLAVPGGEAVTAFVTRAVEEKRPDEASRILRFTMVVSLGLSLIAYAFIAVIVLMASNLLGIEGRPPGHSAYVRRCGHLPGYANRKPGGPEVVRPGILGFGNHSGGRSDPGRPARNRMVERGRACSRWSWRISQASR